MKKDLTRMNRLTKCERSIHSPASHNGWAGCGRSLHHNHRTTQGRTARSFLNRFTATLSSTVSGRRDEHGRTSEPTTRFIRHHPTTAGRGAAALYITTCPPPSTQHKAHSFHNRFTATPSSTPHPGTRVEHAGASPPRGLLQTLSEAGARNLLASTPFLSLASSANAAVQREPINNLVTVMDVALAYHRSKQQVRAQNRARRPPAKRRPRVANRVPKTLSAKELRQRGEARFPCWSVVSSSSRSKYVLVDPTQPPSPPPAAKIKLKRRTGKPQKPVAARFTAARARAGRRRTNGDEVLDKVLERLQSQLSQKRGGLTLGRLAGTRRRTPRTGKRHGRGGRHLAATAAAGPRTDGVHRAAVHEARVESRGFASAGKPPSRAAAKLGVVRRATPLRDTRRPPATTGGGLPNGPTGAVRSDSEANESVWSDRANEGLSDDSVSVQILEGETPEEMVARFVGVCVARRPHWPLTRPASCAALFAGSRRRSRSSARESRECGSKSFQERCVCALCPAVRKCKNMMRHMSVFQQKC